MVIGEIGIAGALVLLHVRMVIKQEPGSVMIPHHNLEEMIVQLMVQMIRIQKNVNSINVQVVILANDTTTNFFKNTFYHYYYFVFSLEL